MSGDKKRTKRVAAARRTSAPPTSDAQRRAAVILEVLAGVRTAQEAAGVLNISSNHYYILERKALAGLVAACEPAAHRGPAPDAELRLKKLEQELARCRQECQRQAALVRATQRAVGVPVTPTAEDTQGKRKRNGKPASRRRRRQPRAARAAQSLQKNLASQAAAEVQQPIAERTGETSPKGTKEDADGAPRT